MVDIDLDAGCTCIECEEMRKKLGLKSKKKV